MVKEGDEVRLVKVTDDKFEGLHPNGINEGYTEIGVLVYPIVVGESVYVGWMRTSRVTEIVDDTTFKTENSTYKIEPWCKPADLEEKPFDVNVALDFFL